MPPYFDPSLIQFLFYSFCRKLTVCSSMRRQRSSYLVSHCLWKMSTMCSGIRPFGSPAGSQVGRFTFLVFINLCNCIFLIYNFLHMWVLIFETLTICSVSVLFYFRFLCCFFFFLIFPHHPGSIDGTVRCWDTKSRRNEPIQLLDEARDSISSLKVSQHELLTGSAHQKWSHSPPRVLMSFSNRVFRFLRLGRWTAEWGVTTWGWDSFTLTSSAVSDFVSIFLWNSFWTGEIKNWNLLLLCTSVRSRSHYMRVFQSGRAVHPELQLGFKSATSGQEHWGNVGRVSAYMYIFNVCG